MIFMHIPFIPPSTNHAYSTTRQGRRFLTKEGEKYKREVTAHILRAYPTELKFFKSNVPLTIVLEVVFDKNAIHSKSYPVTAASRYKRLDVTNRVKLFEDAFVAATNVDDSATFITLLAKRHGAPSEQGVDLWAWSPEEEEDPLHEFLRQLRAARPEPH